MYAALKTKIRGLAEAAAAAAAEEQRLLYYTRSDLYVIKPLLALANVMYAALSHIRGLAEQAAQEAAAAAAAEEQRLLNVLGRTSMLLSLFWH